MQMSPIIAIHLSAALGAVATGPVALWARLARRQRPQLHRAFGYAWVTLMIATAATALFIRDFRLPNLGGYTPIHLLVPVTLLSLVGAFWRLARRDIGGHARLMKRLYAGLCIAGLFTLLPSRYLGGMLWAAMPDVLATLRQAPAWTWAVPAIALAVVLQVRARAAAKA